MNKRFTNLFLSSLLVTIVAAWGVDHFGFSFLPPEFSNLWVMILSALGVVSAISGAIKAAQYIGDLFFPPKPGPSDEETLLSKLRELPWAISEETARGYTVKILEDRSDDFWRQVGENKQNADLLAALVSDPFMLEGLVCVYRSQTGLLPKNTGILLDKLIKTQWTQEKIKVENWIDLNDALDAFGKLVIKDAPEDTYPLPESDSWSIGWEWEGGYIQMLERIGERIYQSRQARQLHNLPVFRVILTPIKMFFALLKMLWTFVVLVPVGFIIPLIVRGLEKIVGSRRIWNYIFWIRKIVDRFRVRPKIFIRDANHLLLLAEKAHLIKRGEDSFSFRHKSWADYFAGHYVAQSSSPIFELTIYDEFNRGWRRLDPDRAGIAICASGLLKDPEQFHRDLLMRDPILLFQCVSSGLELHGEFHENIETTLADEFKKVILQVRDAGEWRSVEFSEALQQLRYDPTDALTMLDAIKEINNEVVNYDLAKLIAKYRGDVVDILISRLDTADSDEKRFISLIQSWIGDRRAASVSRRLPDAADEDDTFHADQKTSVTTLAVVYNDADASAELHTHLFQSMDERWYYWSTLGKIGEKALLWASQLISTWREDYPDRKHIIRREFLDLCSTVGNSEKVREALAQHLRVKNDLAFTHLYIESLGRIKAIEEKDFLMEQLNAVDDASCLYAIEALGNLGHKAAIPSLKQKLFHRNEQIRETTKNVIEKLSRNSTEKSVDY